MSCVCTVTYIYAVQFPKQSQWRSIFYKILGYNTGVRLCNIILACFIYSTPETIHGENQLTSAGYIMVCMPINGLCLVGERKCMYIYIYIWCICFELDLFLDKGMLTLLKFCRYYCFWVCAHFGFNHAVLMMMWSLRSLTWIYAVRRVCFSSCCPSFVCCSALPPIGEQLHHFLKQFWIVCGVFDVQQ